MLQSYKYTSHNNYINYVIMFNLKKLILAKSKINIKRVSLKH